MTPASPLAGTPFYFLGPRHYREAELAAYVRWQHARGRNLVEILNDPYLDRYGNSVRRALLRRPELLRALRHDITDAIRLRQAQLQERRSARQDAHE